MVKKYIGKVFATEKTNPLTNKLEDFLYIIENIEEESEGNYRLHVKDKLDPAVPMVRTKAALTYEQIQSLNYV